MNLLLFFRVPSEGQVHLGKEADRAIRGLRGWGAAVGKVLEGEIRQQRLQGGFWEPVCSADASSSEKNDDNSRY